MPYIAPEVILEAKRMDLLTYLQNYEPQELVHFGGNTYCIREHDSLKISNGKWYWFSRGIGGRSALDYLIKVKEKSFLEAVEMIMGRAVNEPPVFATPKKKQKALLLPEASPSANRVIRYLTGRGIDEELLRFCFSTGRLYESLPYHNAVFIGLDSYGKTRYPIQAGTSYGQTAGRVIHRENVLIRTRGENALSIHRFSYSAGNAAENTLKCSTKEAGRSVKTAEQASKTAIKTGQQAAKSAQATAKTAQKTAQAARAAAQKTAQTAKQTAQAAARAVRAILAGIKALISAILAGGWIAAVVVIIICMIGLLLGSSYGIFFSGEDSGTGMTMRSVIREINIEYDNRLEEIKNTVPHDELEMSGSRAAWKEVLAVYAVKTTTAAEEAQDVSVMDEGRKQLLEALFWDMNEVSYHTETETHTETTEMDDGNGNTVTEETEVTITRLCITVSHKTVEEMAKWLHFDAKQVKQLKELLLPKNDSLWANVLYGIAGGDGEIVSVALSQLGNVGGEPYRSWYGFSGRVEWCACFVSWCANECGYIDAGVIPKFAGCVLGSEWFKEHGQWEERDFIPEAGQIIFFDWEGDGETDHVGIVGSCENGVVHTVEGNSGDACRQREYAVGNSCIYGYGLPAY